jgi:hypothetical protein
VTSCQTFGVINSPKEPLHHFDATAGESCGQGSPLSSASDFICVFRQIMQQLKECRRLAEEKSHGRQEIHHAHGNAIGSKTRYTVVSCPAHPQPSHSTCLNSPFAEAGCARTLSFRHTLVSEALARKTCGLEVSIRQGLRHMVV